MLEKLGLMALPLSSNNLPLSRAPLSEYLIRRVIRLAIRYRFREDLITFDAHSAVTMQDC